MVKSNKAKSWYKCFADPARIILWDPSFNSVMLQNFKFCNIIYLP